VDTEAFQRAKALASLIGGVTRSDREDGVYVPAEELNWCASSLLARFISLGCRLSPPLDRRVVDEELGVGRYDELLLKQLIRVSLGELIVSQVDRFGHAIDQPDADALRRIRALQREPKRRCLWLSRDDVTSTTRTHRVAHPRCPADDFILATLFDPHTHQGVEGFFLQIDRSEKPQWPLPLRCLAAARLWAIADGTNTRDRVLNWLDRLGWTYEIASPALALLDASDRSRIVHTAVGILLDDREVADFERELSLPGKKHAPPPPRRRSLAAIRLFWRDFQGEAFDEARGRFHFLTSLIVQYDSESQGMFSSMLELIEGGATRPYLIYAAGLYLQFNDTPQIAWLLTTPSTVALGLAFLLDLNLVESTMMDGWQQREARLQQRRVLLFRDALALAQRTLVTSPIAADPVIDVLKVMTQGCVRRSLFDQEQHLAKVRRCEELFALTVSYLTEARRGGVHVADPTFEPLLLAEHFSDVLDRLRDDFEEHEVLEQLKIALELLRFIREHVGAFAAYKSGLRDELEARLTALIRDRYEVALAMHVDAVEFVRYVPSPSLPEFPWEQLAASLASTASTAEHLESFVGMPALKEKLQSASDLPAEARDDVVRGVVMRLRTHLGVILGIHQRAGSTVTFAADGQVALRRRIEAEIEILSATDLRRRHVNVFDRGLLYTSDEAVRTTLIEQAMQVLTTATDGDRILRTWLSSTRDATILMAAIDNRMQKGGIKEIARERLKNPSILSETVNDLTFEMLTRTTSAAAAGDHIPLAEGMLAHGDRVMARHPWRARWAKVAFDARLLIAYHRRDRGEIIALPLPESTTTMPVTSQELAEFEGSRAFYIALLDLEASPESARETFARLLQRDPDSSSLLVNLFAAELRVALAITEPALRRAAFEAALVRWRSRTADYPVPDRLEPHGTLNEFVALDGAELDEQFDTRWNELPEPMHSRLDLIHARLDNLRRRGLDVERERLEILVCARFGGQLPESLADVARPISLADEVERSIKHELAWSQIKGLPPDKVARILGPTGTNSTADFLRHLHISAGLSVLKNRLSIEQLGDENSINDVFVSFLEMQLALIGWSVADQSRGGRSGTGARPGSRDWVTKWGTQELAVSEALRLDSVDTTSIQNHVTRVVEKYNPQGAISTFIIVYYEGKAFQSFCTRYRDECPALDFGGCTMRGISDGEARPTLRFFRVFLECKGIVVSQDHILLDLDLQDQREDSAVERSP
jgi:hypothetical protein